MRILLLSLYYPPLNTIAAQRLKSFEQYLSDEGVSVDVLTRYYDPQQQKGQSMFLGKETPANFDNKYVLEKNVIYTNFDGSNSKMQFSAKLPPVLKGLYNYWNVDIYHYSWMNYALYAFEKEWKKNKYDFIIASYGPPIVMLLAKELSAKYNIPFLVDFRDSYIDEKDVRFHLKMKQLVIKRMLKNASGLIFSTDGMKDYFMSKVPFPICAKPSCVVYNGVDEYTIIEKNDDPIVKQFRKIKEVHDIVLLHTGTLYKGQNSAFFVDGVENYIRRKNKRIALVFLGLAENNSNEIPGHSFVFFLPKVTQSVSVQLQREANALLLPIWEGRYTGFSGKTQEYIFSENFIITSPNPQKDLLLFLNLTPNVFVPENQEMLFSVLDKICNNEAVKLPVIEKEKLYRKYWVKQMYYFLKKMI